MKLFDKADLSRPVGEIFDDNPAYSSNNYLISTCTTTINVNNNKIDNKISADSLLILNKCITFATDKGTFVLLTIKKLVLCLI